MEVKLKKKFGRKNPGDIVDVTNDKGIQMIRKGDAEAIDAKTKKKAEGSK